MKKKIKKYSIATKASVLTSLLVLVFGVLVISHEIQTSNRGSISTTISAYDGVKAFNVEGLTDEEIAQYLEEYRENVRGVECPQE